MIRFQRGVQLYDWALPAVALSAMRRACEAHLGAGCTTLASWRRIGPETLAVKSNPDAGLAQINARASTRWRQRALRPR